MDIGNIIDYLKHYDGRPVKLMEVCGTHTAAIFKNGIRELISPKIRLISGPGCPVCVTPAAYIDACIEFAKRPGCELLTFGDMMKVPGSAGSLSENKDSASVTLMYSPFEVLEKAAAHPEITYGIAAVGFETTAPAYALCLKNAREQGIRNIRLITAIKTILPALDWICRNQDDVDGFICPGHVSVITGVHVYDELAAKYGRPFVVAGFEAEHILGTIYRILRQIEQGESGSENLYRNAVREDGNLRAREVMDEVFETGPAVWRGLGEIRDSGLYLRGDYAEYDLGSRDLTEDMELPAACRCSDVIVGRIDPSECPMFGHGCDPVSPYGPCMVSAEGSCGIWFRSMPQKK